MVGTMFFSIILAILVRFTLVTAQDASPTNSTLPAQLGTSTELLLDYDSPDPISGSGTEYYIDFALDASQGRRTPADVLQKVFVSSNIVRITPYNTNLLNNGSIAYISCDPDAYSGQNLKLTDVIQAATKVITTQGSQGAIVLYSLYSYWCNYTQTGSFSYNNVFILPGQRNARNLSFALGSSNLTHFGSIGPITVVDSNGNPIGSGSDSSNNGSGAPPSTTVAMIILYAVTAIITLCFVVVIISGALRARRHPERYGLLNLPGNAHQRRARGIARAMLDTIPIVKFGEKEPMKVTTDVEQGTEMPQIAKSDGHEKEKQKAMSVESDDSVVQERADSSAAESHDARVQADAATAADEADNGLACSVCTEDFVKGEDLRVLPCNHRFHPECIDPWLLNVSGTCPLCRIDLRPPEDREEANADSQTEANALETQGVTAQPGSVPHQAPRFSNFLNRHRMRESTPAQRLRALRALREHQAALNAAAAMARSNTGSVTGTPPRSNRVSRFFGRGNGSSSAIATPTTADQQHSQNPQ